MVNCTNDCGKQLQQKDLQQHMSTECLFRKSPCDYCGDAVLWNEVEVSFWDTIICMDHSHYTSKYVQLLFMLQMQNILFLRAFHFLLFNDNTNLCVNYIYKPVNTFYPQVCIWGVAYLQDHPKLEFYTTLSHWHLRFLARAHPYTWRFYGIQRERAS